MSKPCKYGCGRKSEAGKSRCRTCRRADKALAPAPAGMKVLLLDIETSPLIAYTWGMWDQNVGLPQLIEPTRMLCFAAKWLGDEGTMFFSEQKHGRLAMVKAAWDLLYDADVVMHFNGKKFDIPHLNREFLEHSLTPPAPYAQLDLLLAARKRFNFPSNKLQYISTALGLEGKVAHEGFDLWKKCLAGDRVAWGRMETYNRQDVELLEDLYLILLPWLDNPNRFLYEPGTGCPTCGHSELTRHGYARTTLSRFEQYTCLSCGSWFRSSRRVAGVSRQRVAQ